MSHRWVVVDDGNTAITYSAGWSATDGSAYKSRGQFGDVYQNTLHSSIAKEASFTYRYNGSRGRIYGTTDVKKISTDAFDPSWTCSVDGEDITLKEPFPYTMNNWVLCDWDKPDGQHIITVTVRSQGQAFHFDYIRYVAASDVALKNVDMFVANRDPSFEYGTGWETLGEFYMAPDAGAVLRFPFHGSSVGWWGIIPNEMPAGATTAAYSIDGGPFTTFNVPGNHRGTTKHNHYFFQTPSVPVGPHVLTVTSRGTTALSPLVLSHVVITNWASEVKAIITTDTSTSLATLASTATPLPSSKSEARTASTTELPMPSSSADGPPIPITGPNTTNLDSDDKPKPPIGAIVGAVLGGLVLNILLAFVLIRRRRRTRTRRLRETETAHPFTTNHRPFEVPRLATNKSLPRSRSFRYQQMAQFGAGTSNQPATTLPSANGASLSFYVETTGPSRFEVPATYPDSSPPNHAHQRQPDAVSLASMDTSHHTYVSSEPSNPNTTRTGPSSPNHLVPPSSKHLEAMMNSHGENPSFVQENGGLLPLRYSIPADESPPSYTPS